MIVVGAVNALLRYAGKIGGERLNSNTWIEAQWYLFALIFLLGAADTLRANAHVRVDFVHARYSPRLRAFNELAGTLVFLMPFCVGMLYVTVPWALNSVAAREVSPDPGGLARYPLKLAVPLAFVLLLMQGVAVAMRSWGELRGGSRDGQGARR